MYEPVFSDTSPGPARPRRLTVEFYEESDALVIHRKRGGGPWLFLLLWLSRPRGEEREAVPRRTPARQGR